MGTIRVEEYAGGGLDGRHIMQMPQLPMLAGQNITGTAASAQAGQALQNNTRALRVIGITGNSAFRVSAAGGAAVGSDTRIDQGQTAWFALDPAQVGKGLFVQVIDAA